MPLLNDIALYESPSHRHCYPEKKLWQLVAIAQQHASGVSDLKGIQNISYKEKLCYRLAVAFWHMANISFFYQKKK